MNKKDFSVAMTVLGTAYNKEFTNEQLSVWYEFFYDVPLEIFKSAIKRLIVKNKFLPSIAEVKQEIAIITNPTLQLNAEEEWEKVIATIRQYGSYRASEAIKTLNPFTRKIVNMLGYNKLCLSENIAWERKQFIELFNSYQEKDEKILKINTKQLTSTEGKRIKEIIETKEITSDKTNYFIV